MSHGQSDFRLLDRKVVEILKVMPERNKFIRGLVDWVGFKQTSVEYLPKDRITGKSKFNLRTYISFALDGIFSFTTFPLRLILLIGIIISIPIIFILSSFSK